METLQTRAFYRKGLGEKPGSRQKEGKKPCSYRDHLALCSIHCQVLEFVVRCLV